MLIHKFLVKILFPLVTALMGLHLLACSGVGGDAPGGGLGDTQYTPPIKTTGPAPDMQFPLNTPMIVGNTTTKDSQIIIEGQLWVWEESVKDRVESPSGGTLRIVTQDQSIQEVTLVDKTFDCDPESDVTRTGFFTATLTATNDQSFPYQFFLKRSPPSPPDTKTIQENGETFWLEGISVHPMTHLKNYYYNFCTGKWGEPDFTIPVDVNTQQKVNPDLIKYFEKFNF